MTLEEKLEIEREEGISKGEQNKAIEVAKKMIARGKNSIEEIAEDTSLTIEEIQRLAKSFK